MAVKVYAAARERLLEIWDYTEQRWGEEKADRYVQGLIEEVERVRNDRHRWRPVPDDDFADVFLFAMRATFSSSVCFRMNLSV